jgi:hypothetical protein
MRFLGYAGALVLGLAAGIAAIAVHHSVLGLVLGVGAAVVVIWALRQWFPRAGTAFAAGWLVPLVVGVAGRGEGDYVVASDTYGWLLIGSGFVVMVAGLVWGAPPRTARDSDSSDTPT